MSEKSYWFVGASFDGNRDQTDRFLKEGIWENGYTNRYLAEVRSMKVGDRIAIKSSYTQKNELLFSTRNHTVSVMAIKATGTIIENEGDGRRLKVEWQERFEPIREWYFYTFRGTVWKPRREDWRAQQLIDFTFYGQDQDIDRFRNAPYWRERFGDIEEKDQRFQWIGFYEELANKLLAYKDDRSLLLKFINKIAIKNNLSYLQNKNLTDICPFTVMGIFNRGYTDENRRNIATDLARFLDISLEVPQSFDGIPLLNNQSSWFFAYEEYQKKDDIENLWRLFEMAIALADSITEESNLSLDEFIQQYDRVTNQKQVGWNITMGLYWIRPWYFLTLDLQSQKYIGKTLNLSIKKESPKGRSTGDNYFEILDELSIRFNEEDYPVHSFPELSLIAFEELPLVETIEFNWKENIIQKIEELCRKKQNAEFTRQEFLEKYLKDLEVEYPNNNSVPQTFNRVMQQLRDSDLIDFMGNGKYLWLGELGARREEDTLVVELTEEPIIPYFIEDIIKEGSFLEKDALERMLLRLQEKKNIILQGPPGTGKTWLAKRLAYALMEQKDRRNHYLRSVQFHPNISYEDFVRGWRPSGDGKLTLVDGPFLEMIDRANNNAESNYVVVIEEINRGNPAQIFGEMLTLLESDKRTPEEALELSYRKEEGERVFIPKNLYVIGTMNVADRSLALVDFALRRRFVFIDLMPIFGEKWRTWVNSKTTLSMAVLKEIEERITALNQKIADDPTLGIQFTIGHSYVTPSQTREIADGFQWFKSIVETEIGPLLNEYWFDQPEVAKEAQKGLVEESGAFIL